VRHSTPVYKTEINGPGDSLRWPRDTLYPLKLALTSPTSGGRSIGIVRWRNKATEFVFVGIVQHSTAAVPRQHSFGPHLDQWPFFFRSSTMYIFGNEVSSSTKGGAGFLSSILWEIYRISFNSYLTRNTPSPWRPTSQYCLEREKKSVVNVRITWNTNILCNMNIFLNVKSNGTHSYHCAKMLQNGRQFKC
jgi:hypothetical protein